MIVNILLAIYLLGVCIRLLLVTTEMVFFVIPHLIRTDRFQVHVKIFTSILLCIFLTVFDSIGSWLSFLIVPKCLEDNYFTERILKAHIIYFLLKKQSCLDMGRENITYLHPKLILKELNIFGNSFLKRILSDNIFFDRDFLIFDLSDKDKLKVLLELTE